MLFGRHKLIFAWAWVFAFVSAAGVGVGLLAFGPILKLIIGESGAALPQLARNYNANPETWFTIPEGLITQLPAERFGGVVLIVVGLGLLTVIGAVANFMHQYLSMTLVARVIADVRRRAFEHVLALPLPTVSARGPSEFVSRIVRDTVELQRGLIALTSKAVAHLTKGFAALVVAFIVDIRLSLLAIIVAPILGVVIRKIGKRIRRGTRRSLESQEHLLRIASETIGGLRAVKACTAEQDATDRFVVVNEQVVREELKIRTARALSPPIVETLAVFAIAGLCLIAAKQIIDGSMAFESFIVTLTALGIAGASFRPLAGLINEMQASSAPAARVLETLDLEPERDPPGAVDPPRHAASITFDNVAFTYPEAPQPAVRGVTLTVNHGERVAIVGPNGCGKTTLVSMLPGLLTPTSGRVLIDDVDIAGVRRAALRRQIGVVTQETILFRGSVAENLAYGVDAVTREQITDAARRAHAHDFIEKLTGGYDADLAEQGASLSGGQRQRLAIARAILRDPAILILDEATSQIDAESEDQINQAINEFTADRTALIIAHRLSTVLHADRIVVMDAGAIVDQGVHDALLQRCDLYRRLTNTQLIAAK